MPVWGQYLVAFALVIALAPLIAWTGRRYGRRARTGIALVSLFLGFGAVLDPPSKHLIEAEPQERESPAPGDPPSLA
jgi:hypothetical protein